MKASLGMAAAVSLLALGTAAVAIATVPTPIPTIAGYNLPADLDNGHFILAPPSAGMSRGVGVDVALSRARTYAEEFDANPSGVSVQEVLFTDSHRGVESPDGSITLSFVNLPAYVIRFTGVPQPRLGGVGSTNGPLAEELNVVIDASTGEYVEMFSYK